ncbi:MAG: secondary thiamine-phosphate synthase enzyme YjbQ, partial [Thermoplasmata archaeon]
NGACLIFTRRSTSAVSVMEFEPGLVNDIKLALERLFPKNLQYEHEKKWHDGNGHSHIRATFMKPDLYIPVMNGSLALGTWQQIVFIELDIRSRERSIVVQVIS